MKTVERMKFKHNSFGKRLRSMVKVDSRRMFTTPLFYIMVGVCLFMPILILVMTTMMDGTVTVDPNTGVETTIEAFTNTWQVIGSVRGGTAMDMSLTAMCNINLVYFMAAVLVCLFVAGDFRSGYAKNLFAVRSKKIEYVISKTLVGFVGGMVMLLAFFVGAMLGGTVSSLPFDTGTAGTVGIALCMVAKIFLMAVFVAIYVLMSVIGRQKVWLSLLCSLFGSMLLFMMIPMLTPLDSSLMNVLLCLAGGAAFSIGLGAVSDKVLGRVSLV